MILERLKRPITARVETPIVQGDTSGADEVYADLIDRSVQDERDRKKSFEDRGLSVVTSSGALVTLVAAVAALAPEGVTGGVSAGARTLVTLSLFAFVIAAVLGVAVNFPLDYEEPKVEGLRRLLDDPFWTGRAYIARRARADLALTILAAARGANGLKGNVLMMAIGFEVAAVALLAMAVGGTASGWFH